MKTIKALKQTDIFAVVCLLAAAALLYFYLVSNDGSIAQIEHDGKQIAEVNFTALSENQVKSFHVNGVTIKVDREGAYFAESECKGQDCVKSGKINKAGQTAVCLPQRVSIRITGKARYDGITG